MSTHPSPPTWFYWQKNEELFSKSERTDTFVLAEMVTHSISPEDIEYIQHEVDEFVNMLTHATVSVDQIKRYIGILCEAIDAAKHKAVSLNIAARKAQERASANKNLIDVLENQIKLILQDKELQKLDLEDGRRCKLALSPGSLKSTREPNLDDLKRFGDNIVRQSLSWNLVNLKSALAEGEIDYKWMENNGFSLLRNVSLKIESA